MRLALATYDQAPDLAPDDQPLIPALAAIGIDAETAVWSDEAIEWESFDAVVIRSCWDYHLRAELFREWLDRLETSGRMVMNSPSLIRWNADKRYLLDLARRGVPTVPTMVVRSGPTAAADVEQLAIAEGWPRFVIKPAISASGYETYALGTPLSAEARERIQRVTSVGDTLVQPFADEVPSHGEYSFTFIDGVFSHATIKRARGGEFRVQTEHGGTVDSIDASPALVAQATRVIGVLPEVPLYARVDGIARGDSFLLMELELIEPNLFLGFRDGSAEQLARAIGGRMERG